VASPLIVTGAEIVTDPREQLQPRLDAMLEDATKLLGNAAEMQRKLQELTASTRSEDGFVVTTVDARGRLVQLDLDPRIYRAPNAGALSALIVETYQRAVEIVDVEMRKIIKRYLPDEFDMDKFAAIDFEKYASGRSAKTTGRGSR
jgi:DNA-binding protein YbaB